MHILRNKANDCNKPMSDEQIKLMSKRLAKREHCINCCIRRKGKEREKRERRKEGRKGESIDI